MLIKLFIVSFFIVFFTMFSVRAEQSVVKEDVIGTSFNEVLKLKVFLERQFVDFDFVRRNIKFVDFVNDPKGADVHIILTRNATGSGGSNYLLNFYSPSFSHIGDITLNCISVPGDTQEQIRQCITRALKLGLMPYVNETQSSDMVDIVYTHKEVDEKNVVEVDDPWNLWVFRLDANSGFNIQESKKGYNYTLSTRADKVTETVKIRALYWMNDRYEEIINGDEINYKDPKKKYFRVMNVYSLSDRWSTGLFLTYFQDTKINTRSSIGVKPAIEYSFFPWEEADKRTFTISYFTGAVVKNYYEKTIFDKTNENLWAHSLNVNFELVQPWGQIESSLEGSAYWNDLSKNRISFESDFSIRIVRGLSLRFGLEASSIHDELWTPSGGFSLEDILLGNVKLPSAFEVSGNMGIRIQFGSLYNNVVNNRL